MSPHDKFPSDVAPERIIRALKRLGFVISTKGGKGSHVKATWKNEKSITIQRNLHKAATRSLLQQIENISGVTSEQIREEL